MWTRLTLFFTLLPLIICIEQNDTCKINECGLHLELEKRQQCSPMVRPICDFNSPLVVSLDLLLISIHSIDELSQVFHATVWVTATWNNYLMKWNSEKYEEIDSVIFPLTKTWSPDLCFMNDVNTDKCVKVKEEERVVIQANGTALWWVSRRVNTQCNINIDRYPFDQQNCSITMGTSYSTDEKVILQNKRNHVFMGDFKRSGEWDIVDTSIGIEKLNHEENFTVINFQIKVKRRSLFYIYYVVLPVIILSVLNILCFMLPIESGEKIGFSVAVFLTFAVFLSIISSSVPKVSSHQFHLGIYMTIELLMSAITIAMEVFVIRLYHRPPERHVGWPLCLLKRNPDDDANRCCFCPKQCPNCYGSDISKFIDNGRTGRDNNASNPWQTVAKRMDKIFGIAIAFVNIASLLVYFVNIGNALPEYV